MTLGIDVSRLFPDMIMACNTKDLVVKKMVYLYLVRSRCKFFSPPFPLLRTRAFSHSPPPTHHYPSSPTTPRLTRS
jgi:hypothetical protein